MEDSYGPYSLLTIGDQNYVEDKRFLVARPVRGPTNVSSTYNSYLQILCGDLESSLKILFLKIFRE